MRSPAGGVTVLRARDGRQLGGGLVRFEWLGVRGVLPVPGRSAPIAVCIAVGRSIGKGWGGTGA
ncbi:hypothetical protein ABT187_31295 [Streptomyces sp. NPDC001817]|uniref:hypothetical protein n=1 Tax=Streptomyces sp. NPDC001817 TaxID=3154398 RepID=UPI0033212F50